MRRVGMLMALAVLTACSGSRQAVRQQVRGEQVRVDSLAALMAEELHVSLHNVVITPVDSPLVRVYVKEIELNRDRTARVDAQVQSRTQAEAVSEQKPVPGTSTTRRLSFALGALVTAICLVIFWRKRG